MKFEEFKLNEHLMEALSYMGFDEATPIQEQAIPKIFEGKDIIASAQTGTGKTAAFLLPILHKLTDKHDQLNTLIIVPTRELAIQIDQQIEGFSYFTHVTSLPVYGGGEGQDWDTQKKALTKGAEIIVATPGKLISHLNMGYVKFDHLQHLILDEADRMLDMGFHDDIQKIITFLPKKRQTLMFSATMPPKIRELARKALVDPVEITIALSKPVEGVIQAVCLTYDSQKTPLINSMISNKPDVKSILVFTSTKKKVSEIVRGLKSKNYKVEGISSDLVQNEREEVLLRFRSKQTRVLVATDVAARGLDVDDINFVINYDVPGDPEDYVHRIGRTARADTKGVALTLVNEDDMYKFDRIEKLIEKKVQRVTLPEALGDGPQWKPKSYNKGGWKPSRGKGKNFKKKK
ncbi:MAG: DEAD/DEAH box helicase [Cyclobacteriaceae bacterium]|nr:DEAD/DEAH box helicase [Cyclobacteriaceae bacterium]